MSINFSAFEIGRRALNANQAGISVTGNNIANVNTPGYSRQRVQLAEGAPTNIAGYSVGTGVTIAGIQDFRDSFIESRLQTETGIAGRLNARRDALAPVESALQGSASGGLQNSLNGFFGAFRDLEANPSSVPLRSVVAQKGANIANSFQSTRTRLSEIQFGVDAQISTNVEQVNSLSEKIANLNAQIQTADQTGGNASSLRDQRGEFVKQLSELTGARATDNQDGTLTITIGEGRALVTGNVSTKLTAAGTPPLGLTTIKIEGEPAVFDEGSIRGLQDALGETSKQITALDGLAAAVVDRVNQLHTGGTDLDGNAGAKFFDDSTLPVTAANIKINADITTNPRLVVASPLTQPGEAGTVAGEIANLLTDKNTTVGAKTGSFSSIFGSIISEVGEQVRSADDALQTQSAIISQLTAQREAVSGVSLDEEAINLMQYQKAYEAAARFMKVADEMTQTILSLAQ